MKISFSRDANYMTMFSEVCSNFGDEKLLLLLLLLWVF